MAITRAIIGCTLFLSTALAMSSVGLEDFRWKNRLLIYFYLSEDQKEVVESRLEKYSDAVRERDLLVGYVQLGKPPLLASSTLEETSIETLVSGSGITKYKSAVVLIGKDGTIKFNGSIDTALSELFTLIDSMPMRKREMKNQAVKGNS